MEGASKSVESMILDEDAYGLEGIVDTTYANDFVGDSIQFSVRGFRTDGRMAFKAIHYDVQPERKKRNVALLKL